VTIKRRKVKLEIQISKFHFLITFASVKINVLVGILNHIYQFFHFVLLLRILLTHCTVSSRGSFIGVSIVKSKVVIQLRCFVYLLTAGVAMFLRSTDLSMSRYSIMCFGGGGGGGVVVVKAVGILLFWLLILFTRLVFPFTCFVLLLTCFSSHWFS